MAENSKNKIKIIQVIAESGLSGGPRHVLGLLSHIDREKFDVLLIAPKGWLTSEADKIKGIKIKTVEFKSKFDLSSFVKLKKDIAEFRASGDPFAPIIIHAHGPRAASFCRWALRAGEKFIYTEHIWSSYYHIKNPFNSILQKIGLKGVYRRADLVIAVSKSVRKFIENMGIKGEKISIIPNAIEIADVAKPDKKSDQLLVGTVGVLVKRKGYIYLIRAFQKVAAGLPKARLEIVGDGPEKENLLAEVKKLDLESRVQFLGHQDKPEKFLKSWDLFVLPSLSETFGLVILEAFAVKVPVVASGVDGIPELISDKKTGYLVPPADPEKLAKAISYLLVEKKERESLSNQAYELLKKHYDWSKIIEDIEEEYQKLTR